MGGDGLLKRVGGGVEDSLLVVYHKKRLVTSLPENHYGERFLWCMGCSTHVGIVEGGASGAGEGKGLVFPNFSYRGGGGGHLYPAGEPLTFSRILGWF